MITKEYRMFSLSYFSTTLKVVSPKGSVVKKRIAFTPVSLVSCGCSYTTSDLQEQLALEKTDMFRRGEIIIAATYGVAPEETTVVKQNECKKEVVSEVCECPTEVKEYVRVKSVQAASNVLVRDYGADPDEVDDADKVIAYGRKVGASFPNLSC